MSRVVSIPVVGLSPAHWRAVGTLTFWSAGVVTVLWIAWKVATVDSGAFGPPTTAVAAILAGLVILRWPYLGLVATIAILPVQQVLPRVPGVGSVATLVGLLTIGAAAFATALGTLPRPRWNRVHVISGLFVIWIIVSNPAAALLGDRVWVLTYAQLWVVLLLGGWLLQEEWKHRVVAWSLLLAGAASVVIGFTEEGMWPPTALSLAGRLSTPAGTANEQAVYLLCGVALALWLGRSGHRSNLARSATLALLGTVAVGGFFAALSRTALAAAVAVILLLTWREVIWHRTLRPLFFLACGVGLTAVFIPPEYVSWVIERVWNAVFQGFDGGMGSRYVFWQIGIDIWIESPVSGAGIGSFTEVASNDIVAQLGINKGGAAGHNSYVNVLSETGLVGLALFTAFQFEALRGLWRGVRGWPRALSTAWLVVLVTVMFGGLAHGYQYNKLLWLAAGIGSLGLGRDSLGRVPASLEQSGDRGADGRSG